MKRTDTEIQQELLTIVADYYKVINKFCSKNRLFGFVFSVEIFEICATIFDDISIKNIEQFTEQNFNDNEYFFNRLCFALKLEYSFNNCYTAFLLYMLALTIADLTGQLCDLYSTGMRGIEVLDKDQVRQLVRESKYKFMEKQECEKNGGKFKNYFYEFNGLDFSVMNYLKLCDAIRAKLLDNGDTIELINKRDFAVSLHKYYEYLSESVKYGFKKN